METLNTEQEKVPEEEHKIEVFVDERTLSILPTTNGSGFRKGHMTGYKKQ